MLKVSIKIIVLFFTFSVVLSAQIKLNEEVSISFYKKTLEEVVNYLEKQRGLKFIYAGGALNSNTSISCNYKNIKYEDLFNIIFKKNNIAWIILKDQVVLRKFKPEEIEYEVEGIIYSKNDSSSLAYASVALSKENKGVLSDNYGNFSLTVNKTNLEDTVYFVALGYKTGKILLKDILKRAPAKIYLEKELIKLPELSIEEKKLKEISMGNKALLSFGSMYLDTHGQQVAVYLENNKGYNGYIEAVNIFLDKKGNSSAPLRIRFFSCDTNKIKPGKEIISAPFVVNPDIEKGWYRVELNKFRVFFPENGLFIALQGIYPGEYYEKNEKNEILVGGERLNSLSYGQRIGYKNSLFGKNNTWHFSLNETWFQLEKQSFNVLIYADLKVYKK